MKRYLSEVLGIESYIIPEGYKAPSEPQKTLDVFFLVDKTPDAEEQSLFNKITKAMGLKTNQYKLSTDKNSFSSKIRIHFSSEYTKEAGHWGSQNDQVELVTVGLDTMLKKPSTKKAAWKDLQDAMEKLK
jgi:hypothetical protein